MSEMKKIIDNDTERVNFGAQRVPLEEKSKLVKDIFDRVASRYDIMNDIMSMGTHRIWKKQMLDVLVPKEGSIHLDVAGGTGDIGFRIISQLNEPARVIVCDLSEKMVVQGRSRAWDRGILNNIEWVVGNAENLPIEDNSVDSYSIAFGIRNVTEIDKVLVDAARVLRPGGRFVCLEFSPHQIPGFDLLYRLYSFSVIPLMGQIVARDVAAYRYLVESIQKFPPPKEFSKMIEEAGFGGIAWRSLSGGIAGLHSGWRI